MNQSLFISCPRCGKQYHFQEIFHPKTIFNSVYNVIRNENNQIEEVVEEESNYSELYFCDDCGAPINVVAKLSFETTINHKFDFTKDTVIIKND